MNHSRTLSSVLLRVRDGSARTRPELMRRTDLGRSLVDQRVEDGIRGGLLEETADEVRTGGRPAKTLRFRSESGLVLTVMCGVSRLVLSVTDLDGREQAEQVVAWDITEQPTKTLEMARDAAERMMGPDWGRLWAVVVGLPGPVDADTGTSLLPPVLTGWHRFAVVEHVERAFGVPAFVDNDVNLHAIGAWRTTRRPDDEHVLFVKVGTGIGAGVITNGHLVRGASGAAGDIGHVEVAEHSPVQCRCGRFGCLEAFAGGWSLARDASTPAIARSSTFLQDRIDREGTVEVEDILEGVRRGDDACRELLQRSATLIGRTLSVVVSAVNPSAVLIAGRLSDAGDWYVQAIGDEIRRRILPFLSSPLRIQRFELARREGAIGAAARATEGLLSPRLLASWFDLGSPRGVPTSAPGLRRPAGSDR